MAGGALSRIETDILLVGSGLGATAAARGLLAAGYRVVLVPGIGRARSPHIDGGLVDGELVASAFGDGAPLGEVVERQARFRLVSPDRFEVTTPERIESRRRYRRKDLERWTMEGVVAAGGVFIEDLIEGKALPQPDGSIVLTSERDARMVRAGIMALCEGADPRIPLRVHLRPDYGPEDQLHFARTILHGPSPGTLLHGSWRTAWGMPVEVALVPQEDGTLVSVATRIENVMRASRSSKDALEDLLRSDAFATLGVEGGRGETGMELMALRPRHREMRFVHDRMLMAIDFSGVIDPRRIDRADLTIRAGRHLAAYLAGNRLAVDGWEEQAMAFVRETLIPPATYHEGKVTGYLHEGPARGAGAIASRLAGLVRRGPRATTGTR